MALSIPRLVLAVLEGNAALAAAAPGGVLVGPPEHDEQQAGCVSLMEAGQPREEPDLPLMWLRLSARCLAPSLKQSSDIGTALYGAVHGLIRQVVRQLSDGHSYLLHCMFVNGGPSSHRDSDVTWETLVFIEALAGTEAIE